MKTISQNRIKFVFRTIIILAIGIIASFLITFVFPEVFSYFLQDSTKTATSFRHIKDTKKSEILVVIRAGH
ncbi:MAG: hypothetical protein PHE56_08230, partial [Bacteroidales bacterium]|nr:hypothetical protein [Bacteroidales bacterium]